MINLEVSFTDYGDDTYQVVVFKDGRGYGEFKVIAQNEVLRTSDLTWDLDQMIYLAEVAEEVFEEIRRMRACRSFDFSFEIKIQTNQERIAA